MSIKNSVTFSNIGPLWAGPYQNYLCNINMISGDVFNTYHEVRMMQRYFRSKAIEYNKRKSSHQG